MRILQRIVVSIAVPLTLCASVAYAQRPGSLSKKQVQTHPIPIDVVYRLFLRHVATFEQQAQELENQGKDGSSYRNHVIRKFSINADQFGAVASVATDFGRALDENEVKARSIVAAFQEEHFPGGRLRLGETPPPPPAELKLLNNERRQLTLQAMQRLHDSLGDQDFYALDATLRGRFAGQIQVGGSGSGGQD